MVRHTERQIRSVLVGEQETNGGDGRQRMLQVHTLSNLPERSGVCSKDIRALCRERQQKESGRAA